MAGSIASTVALALMVCIAAPLPGAVPTTWFTMGLSCAKAAGASAAATATARMVMGRMDSPV